MGLAESKEVAQHKETCRTALTKELSLSTPEIIHLENLFIKHSYLLNFSGNIYKAYAYDNDRSNWNIKGFAEIMGVHPAISGAMFRMMDNDGDGTLDFLELVRGWARLNHGSRLQSLELLFKVFDTNDDKKLDKAEVKVMVRAIIKSFHNAAMSNKGVGGGSLASVAKIKKAQRLGISTDAKKIDEKFEKEVVRVADSLFTLCDLDGDGEIDSEEFKQIVSAGTCMEMNKVLDSFSGGALAQWNALGMFLVENGMEPSERDYEDKKKESELAAASNTIEEVGIDSSAGGALAGAEGGELPADPIMKLLNEATAEGQKGSVPQNLKAEKTTTKKVDKDKGCIPS